MKIFFFVLNLMTCGISFASEVSCDFGKNILSPNKAMEALFGEKNGKNGVIIKCENTTFFNGSVSPIFPIVWATDSSGVFVVEHLAHGNCISFLSIEDTSLVKYSIDPELDHMRGYRLLKIILEKTRTQLEFLVNLQGINSINRYSVKYILSYDHKSKKIQEIQIEGISNIDIEKLTKKIEVIQIHERGQ